MKLCSTAFAVPFEYGMLSERDINFAQLLQSSITPAVGLDESLQHIATPSKHSASFVESGTAQRTITPNIIWLCVFVWSIY